MAISYYGTTVYGVTYYGEGAGIDVPNLLTYHINEVDGMYTFYWTLNSLFIGPGLDNVSWELDISNDIAFPPASTTTYTAANASFFHDAGPIKGYDIVMSPRQYDNVQTIYARVRSVTEGGGQSDYSYPMTVTIGEDFSEKFAESLMEILPDEHVYNKDVLRLPLSERLTNLFNVFRMYGSEFDFLKLATLKLSFDISIEVGRDEMLFDNFGSYFDYERPAWMDYLQYRLTLKALYESIFYSGTDYAIQRIVAAFTGVYPDILNIRDIANFYVYSDTTYIYDSALKWLKYNGDYSTALPVVSVALHGYEAQGPLPHLPPSPAIGRAWVANNWGGTYVNGDVYEWTGVEWIRLATLEVGQNYVLAPDAVGVGFSTNVNNIATWTGASWTYSAPVNGELVVVRRQENQDRIALGSYIRTNSKQYTAGAWIPYDGAVVPNAHVVSAMLQGDEAYAGVAPVGVYIGECRIANNWGAAYENECIYEWNGTAWIYQGVLDIGDTFVIANSATGSFALQDKKIATRTEFSWTFTTPTNEIVVIDGKERRSIVSPLTPVIYDKNSMAFGIRIHVNNPGNFTIDLALIKYLLDKVIPVHIYYEVT